MNFSERHENGNTTQKSPKVLILGVMVPGKQLPDRCEWRIRYRVAVTNGMAESGYIPCENEYMDYFAFVPYKIEETHSPVYSKQTLHFVQQFHQTPFTYQQ